MLVSHKESIPILLSRLLQRVERANTSRGLVSDEQKE